jgi:acetyl-CoA carboxylase biotin carboxyl carrier protein
MDVDEIKALMEAMNEHDVSEVVVREGESRVVLRRGVCGSHMTMAHTAMSATPQMTAAPAMATAAPAPTASGGAPASAAADDNLLQIKAPMVGTFYAKPSPDAAAFVKAGDSVSADTVVCIIEAMKVFNEIKADVSGKVERIHVEDGAAVEFGQVLLTVRPHA